MIVFIEMSTYWYYHIVYIGHYCDVMNQVVDNLPLLQVHVTILSCQYMLSFLVAFQTFLLFV